MKKSKKEKEKEKKEEEDEIILLSYPILREIEETEK